MLLLLPSPDLLLERPICFFVLVNVLFGRAHLVDLQNLNAIDRSKLLGLKSLHALEQFDARRWQLIGHLLLLLTAVVHGAPMEQR